MDQDVAQKLDPQWVIDHLAHFKDLSRCFVKKLFDGQKMDSYKFAQNLLFNFKVLDGIDHNELVLYIIKELRRPEVVVSFL